MRRVDCERVCAAAAACIAFDFHTTDNVCTVLGNGLKENDPALKGFGGFEGKRIFGGVVPVRARFLPGPPR